MLTYEELQVLCTLGWLTSIALAAALVVSAPREQKKDPRAEFCPLCRLRHTPDEPHGPNRDDPSEGDT